MRSVQLRPGTGRHRRGGAGHRAAAFAVASLPENMDEDLALRLAGVDVVPMMGLETALAAIRAAQTAPGRAGWRPWAVVPTGPLQMLDEAAAKARLATAGVSVPRGMAGPILRDLGPGQAGLTPPYALKGLGFAHKTEAGAVRLDLAHA